MLKVFVVEESITNPVFLVPERSSFIIEGFVVIVVDVGCTLLSFPKDIGLFVSFVPVAVKASPPAKFTCTGKYTPI